MQTKSLKIAQHAVAVLTFGCFIYLPSCATIVPTGCDRCLPETIITDEMPIMRLAGESRVPPNAWPLPTHDEVSIGAGESRDFDCSDGYNLADTYRVCRVKFRRGATQQQILLGSYSTGRYLDLVVSIACAGDTNFSRFEECGFEVADGKFRLLPVSATKFRVCNLSPDQPLVVKLSANCVGD